MRKLLLLLVIGLTTASCGTEESRAIKVVNTFLTQINKQQQPYDTELATYDFNTFFKGKNYYASTSWKLNTLLNGEKCVIEAIGKTHNGLGHPMEITQGFALINDSGKWLIADTYNFVINEFAFKVVDTQWDFYWDKAKYDIINELRQKLSLKVITPARAIYYGSSRQEGVLKLVNNSDYDVEDIRILIEHYDKSGHPIKTAYWYVQGIIRNHGYRQFEWTNGDCADSYKQTYKICFENESHYQ